MIGIYKITNLINGKCYIGKSLDVEKRLKEHRELSPKSRPYLINAIKKYGIQNFLFEILEESTIEKYGEREEYWIKYYNSLSPNGYNLTTGNEKKCGWHHNEETKKKISKSHIDANYRGKRNKNYGKTRPPEVGEKVSKTLKIRMLGENNPFYGKTHSEESRKKISDSVKKAYAEGRIVHSSGYKMSEATKEKCRQRMIGNTHSKGKMNGRILINNGSISKQINPEDLQSYLNQGWIKGRIGKSKSNGREGKIRISNGERKKFILPEELSKYEAEGWFRG